MNYQPFCQLHLCQIRIAIMATEIAGDEMNASAMNASSMDVSATNPSSMNVFEMNASSILETLMSMPTSDKYPSWGELYERAKIVFECNTQTSRTISLIQLKWLNSIIKPNNWDTHATLVGQIMAVKQFILSFPIASTLTCDIIRRTLERLPENYPDIVMDMWRQYLRQSKASFISTSMRLLGVRLEAGEDMKARAYMSEYFRLMKEIMRLPLDEGLFRDFEILKSKCSSDIEAYKIIENWVNKNALELHAAMRLYPGGFTPKIHIPLPVWQYPCKEIVTFTTKLLQRYQPEVLVEIGAGEFVLARKCFAPVAEKLNIEFRAIDIKQPERPAPDFFTKTDIKNFKEERPCIFIVSWFPGYNTNQMNKFVNPFLECLKRSNVLALVTIGEPSGFSCVDNETHLKLTNHLCGDKASKEYPLLLLSQNDFVIPAPLTNSCFTVYTQSGELGLSGCFQVRHGAHRPLLISPVFEMCRPYGNVKQREILYNIIIESLSTNLAVQLLNLPLEREHVNLYLHAILEFAPQKDNMRLCKMPDKASRSFNSILNMKRGVDIEYELKTLIRGYLDTGRFSDISKIPVVKNSLKKFLSLVF